MMKNTGKKLILMALVSIGGASAAFGFAQAGGASLLQTLDRGMWQFRAIGGGRTGAIVDKLCVNDQKKLAQIQHNRISCTQEILRSNAATALISYNCPGQGHGLTSIRKESSSLIHIDSQGIYNGSPFSFTVEARRNGSCTR